MFFGGMSDWVLGTRTNVMGKGMRLLRGVQQIVRNLRVCSGRDARWKYIILPGFGILAVTEKLRTCSRSVLAR